MKFIPISVAALLLALAAKPSLAGGKPLYGAGLEGGSSFKLEEVGWCVATFSRIEPYGDFWKHAAPKGLMNKFELTAGTELVPAPTITASGNILAMQYLDRSGSVRPYGEAGIGIIYTEHKREKQGLHVNFNPILGIGLEFLGTDRPYGWAAVRLHHVSNGGLNKDNVGIDSLLAQVGIYF